MPRKDAILKIRISDDLKSEVETIANATGETVAVIVRQALREYLDRLRTRDDQHRPLRTLGTISRPYDTGDHTSSLKVAEPSENPSPGSSMAAPAMPHAARISPPTPLEKSRDL